MRKLLFILMGLIALTFTGCVDVIEGITAMDVPNLEITSDNQEILVEKGGYEWTKRVGLFKKESIVACAASPEEIAKAMTGDKITSQAKLNLDFTDKPDKVTVIPWGELKDEEYTSTEETITIPKKEGIYIFEVIGEWSQGKVSYIIKLIAENN